MSPLTIVAGIDLSLTSTGVARIYIEHPDIDHATRDIETSRIQSTAPQAATLDQRNKRLTKLAHDVVELTAAADLVVIEQPAYSRTVGHAHDRSGLWWLVVNTLIEEYGCPVAEVSPTTRPKYATGRNAAKDQVLAAVIRRYPDVNVTGNDVADALVLAAMGARHLGHPIEASLPLAHLAAMDAVRWPQTPNREREPA